MNLLITAIAVVGVTTLGSVIALTPGTDVTSASAEGAAKTTVQLRSGKVVQSPGKASAAISMTHRLVGDVVIGQPLTLELYFAASEAERMQVEIRAADELSGQTQQLSGVEHNKAIEVDLLPLSEGRFYVNIFTRIDDGKHSRARAFSVPVQVGKGTAKSVAHKASRSANGELLIRMPSQ
ncbi:MAG: hypothetical protein HKM98_07730 [Gammaproteobacteria bacterium]|nr:hypothetical protein [Gammaproteobacteria bacterium]